MTNDQIDRIIDIFENNTDFDSLPTFKAVKDGLELTNDQISIYKERETNQLGQTPLMYAVVLSKLDYVKKLYNKYVDEMDIFQDTAYRYSLKINKLKNNKQSRKILELLKRFEYSYYDLDLDTGKDVTEYHKPDNYIIDN